MNVRLYYFAAAMALTLSAAAARADEQAIRKVFTTMLPDVKVSSVTKLPYGGLYEVVVERPGGIRIFYADDKAQFVLAGANLIDTATQRSITGERLRKLTSIDWNALPFKWAVTTQHGAGRRQIAIFSDPNCPYCKQFETDLAKLDDLTVHIFMYPVVKPESMRQAKSVWCSKDRSKSWNDLMLKRIEPAATADCATPIDELVALGKKLGANGTPTWFLPNGEKHQGALPMSEVVPLLDATARR